jgi:hypothetical protein
VEESFHLVLRKNSISYKNFISYEGALVVQSTSLIDFHVEVEDKANNIKSNKVLRAGKFISFPEVLNS